VKIWLKNMSRLEMFSETIKKYLHVQNLPPNFVTF
jgi:hypothetical protein